MLILDDSAILFAGGDGSMRLGIEGSCRCKLELCDEEIGDLV